jgi:hypothetical protein
LVGLVNLMMSSFSFPVGENPELLVKNGTAHLSRAARPGAEDHLLYARAKKRGKRILRGGERLFARRWEQANCAGSSGRFAASISLASRHPASYDLIEADRLH